MCKEFQNGGFFKSVCNEAKLRSNSNFIRESQNKSKAAWTIDSLSWAVRHPAIDFQILILIVKFLIILQI